MEARPTGVITVFEKFTAWCLKRWKGVLAFLGLVAAAAAMYFRSKDQKKILDYTIKSYEEEEAANKEAEDALVKGIEDIQKEKDEKLQAAEESHAKDKEELDSRKSDFIEKASKDENLENLAKDLADQIGADFVK